MIKLPPAEGQKYFYNHNQAIYVKSKSSTDYYKVVTKGTPVSNLRLDDGFYYFQLEGDDEQYRCFYAWAFVLDMPWNRARWHNIWQLQAALEMQQLAVKVAYKSLETLEDKSSIPNGTIRMEF